MQTIISIETKTKLNEDIFNYQKIILENEKEKNAIQLSLDQNIKVKSLLKKLLFKFISNTQMKEIKELKENYSSMLNEKRELEIKNKTYQEYLSAVMKEKEEKLKKISEVSKELKLSKQILFAKQNREKELQKKLNHLDCYPENTRISNQGRINVLSFESLKKTSIKNLSKYFDDCDIRTFFPSRLKKEERATSRSRKRIINKPANHNFISINLNQNIPTVTAYIQGGDIFTKKSQLNNSKKEIKDLRNNLQLNNVAGKVKYKTINQEYEANNDLTSGKKLHKTNSINNLTSVLNNSSSLIKEEISEGLKGNNSLLNLASNLKGNNVPILHHFPSKKIQVNQLQKKINQRGNSKKNNCNENKNNHIDNVSFSMAENNIHFNKDLNNTSH